MEQQRFIVTGNHSLYGEYLYDQVIPGDHFLRKLRQIIDWNRFTRKLIKLYKGEGVVGRPVQACAGYFNYPSKLTSNEIS